MAGEQGRNLRRNGVECLAGFFVFVLAAHSLLADSTSLEVHPNDRIVDVVERVREQGIRVAYSASLLPRRLRVIGTPMNNDPVPLLNEVLRDHGLRVQQVGELWVVVRQGPPDAPPAFALFDVISSETGQPVSGDPV